VARISTTILIAAVAATFAGCGTALPRRSVGPYQLSVDELRLVTEQTLTEGDWMIVDAPASRTEAILADGSSHETRLIIRYRDAGEGTSTAVFEGKSDGPWVSLGLVGLSGKTESMKHVDEALDAVDAKAKE
jgi:hypothetical protein